MAEELVARRAAARLRQQHGSLLSGVDVTNLRFSAPLDDSTRHLAAQRAEVITGLVIDALSAYPAEARSAVRLVAEWIDQRALVRVLTFGALPAVGLPVYHLAKAGAHVHVDGGWLPTADPVHGGGLVVALAEGEHRTVADILYKSRRANRDLKILGFGPADLPGVAECCDVFLGLPLREETIPVGGHALAQIFDAVVAQAIATLGRMPASRSDDA